MPSHKKKSKGRKCSLGRTKRSKQCRKSCPKGSRIKRKGSKKRCSKKAGSRCSVTGYKKNKKSCRKSCPKGSRRVYYKTKSGKKSKRFYCEVAKAAEEAHQQAKVAEEEAIKAEKKADKAEGLAFMAAADAQKAEQAAEQAAERAEEAAERAGLGYIPQAEAAQAAEEARQAAGISQEAAGIAAQAEEKAEEAKAEAAGIAARAEELGAEAKEAEDEARAAAKAERDRMEEEERERSAVFDRIAEEQQARYGPMTFVQMVRDILGSGAFAEGRDMNKRTLISLYRRASIQVHPDKHQSSPEEIAKYTEIFKILSDKYQEESRNFEPMPSLRLKYRLYKHKVRRHYKF